MDKSKMIPVVDVKLDRPRKLKYDFKAMRLIEKETSKNMLNPKIWQEMNATDLSIFVWAGLKHEDPNLTVEHVEEMLHPGNMAETIYKVGEAWGLSMPEAKEAGEQSPLA